MKDAREQDGQPRNIAARDGDEFLLERRPIFTGRIVDLSLDRVRYPDGSEGELEFIRHSGASAVLPLLSGADGPDPQILLIRQFRYAAGGLMLEVPAGRPEAADEDWEVCARRELEEETGLTADHVSFLTTIYTTPGFTNERIHLFVATGLRTGTQALDVDEFLEPVRLRMSEALEMVRDGRISDGKTICTLLYVAGFRLGL